MEQLLAFEPPRERSRVLLIDDERAIGRALTRILASTCDVAVETRGEDALLRVERGERFDVILCDLHMPEMDGAAVHAELLRVAPEQAARVVFVTGDSREGWVAQRPNVALAKPFDIDALRALIRARTRT